MSNDCGNLRSDAVKVREELRYEKSQRELYESQFTQTSQENGKRYMYQNLLRISIRNKYTCTFGYRIKLPWIVLEKYWVSTSENENFKWENFENNFHNRTTQKELWIRRIWQEVVDNGDATAENSVWGPDKATGTDPSHCGPAKGTCVIMIYTVP